MRRAGRRPTGFTLIELLVVVAILVLLMAILSPSLRKGRELALSANWLRIMATAWIAHRWGTDAAESFFHGAAGVLSFLLALLLLVALAQLRFPKAVN